MNPFAEEKLLPEYIEFRGAVRKGAVGEQLLARYSLTDVWTQYVKPRNTHSFYHNADHMLTVACIMSWLMINNGYTPERGDILAAIMHDHDHSLGHLTDRANIERATTGLLAVCREENIADFEYADHLIRLTEFPFKIENNPVTLAEKALRDADLLYSMTTLDRMGILLALNNEMSVGKPERSNILPQDLVIEQAQFWRSVRMYTDQGIVIRDWFAKNSQRLFMQSLIQ